MKKFFKKPVLLLGSLAAVVGFRFVSDQHADVKAQSGVEWCQWINDPSRPDIDGCKVLVFDTPCICEGC
ncbi:hypothetical protein [Lunatimonas lonarensis]|uniref:hypothetical protein n=1 Tax=Lunatimonas lonarensis TaxID=1232681 RepID=UPI00056A267C|nr:hypothetical protein [Lunatimonas lonarensis]